jgi:hypothetical protein
MLKTENKSRIEVEGKPFSCPLCGAALPIRMSVKGKPYCVCNDCGIQMFFRGKAGIERLHVLLQGVESVRANSASGTTVIALYNRLEQLREQREEMESKQGIIFRNQALDDAIAALDAEI